MSGIYYSDILDVLRAAGCKVAENATTDGWQTRARSLRMRSTIMRFSARFLPKSWPRLLPEGLYSRRDPLTACQGLRTWPTHRQARFCNTSTS